MIINRSLGHRAPLLWLVVPLMAGLAAGKSIGLGAPGWQLGVALAAAVFAVFAAWRAPRLWGPALLAAMILAGSASYALHRARLPAWDTLPAREARLSLRVDRVFPLGDEKRSVGLGTIMRAEGHLQDVAGQRIYFSLTRRKGEPPPTRSAVVSAVGVIIALPRDPPANTFDGYLAGAGVNFRLTRGRVLREEVPATPYFRFCATAAKRFKETLGQGIAEKRPALAGLLRAMMLGETHELSDEQHTLFMQSGTMHLFAISGLNIGVIATSLQALLLLLRLPLWVRFFTGTSLLWLFVDITGTSPSAVRALVMTVFIMAALVLRRPSNPLAALVASAAAVLLISPLQLFSASFIMSYGIVAALLVLGLPLAEAWLARWTPWRDLPESGWHWWQRRAGEAWRATAAALAIGIATTLVSLLTGVQFFNLLTPGALVANLVLIPAAMAATLGGFAAVLCGLVGFGPGVVLCNHASALVLLVIEWLVTLSVKLPGAFVPARFTTPWLGAASLSLLLVALLVGYATNWRRHAGGWWPPFAIVALTLALGVKFG